MPAALYDTWSMSDGWKLTRDGEHTMKLYGLNSMN